MINKSTYVINIINFVLWSIIGIVAVASDTVNSIKFIALLATYICSQTGLLITCHFSIPDGKAHLIKPKPTQPPAIRDLIKSSARLYYTKKLVHWVSIAPRSDLPVILAVFHYIHERALKLFDYSNLTFYKELIEEEEMFEEYDE